MYLRYTKNMYLRYLKSANDTTCFPLKTKGTKLRALFLNNASFYILIFYSVSTSLYETLKIPVAKLSK